MSDGPFTAPLTDVVPAHGPALAEGDIDGVVRTLRTASLAELRDERLLRDELLPCLGLNGENLWEFPEALYPWCGKGVRSWQYPAQFARYLAFLSGRDIRSYLEIGCRFGGTFIIVVEYLRRFADLRRAVALDIEPTGIMAAYAAATEGVEYQIADSTSPEMVARLGAADWDLAFIDGDHSYEGCRRDYETVRQRARLVALHDIASAACPGVFRTWQEIRRVMPARRTFEAIEQYREVFARQRATYLGIGVVDFG